MDENECHTDLTLRITAEREGVVIADEKQPVELLAQNVPPNIPCVVCGKPATKIMADYYDYMEHSYCDECMKNLSGDDSGRVIEVVNSPRIGIIS